MTNASYSYQGNQSLVAQEFKTKELLSDIKVNIVKYSIWLFMAIAMGFIPKPLLPTALLFPFAAQQSLLHKSKEQITLVENENKSMKKEVNVLVSQNQQLQIEVKSLLAKGQQLDSKQEESTKIANKAQIRSHLATLKLQEIYVQNRQLKAEIARQQRESEKMESKIANKSVSLNNEKVATKAHGYISIDGNNFFKSRRELNLDIDWHRLRNYLTKLVGNIDDYSLTYYTGVNNNRRNEEGFVNRLKNKYGYKVITFDVSQYSDGTKKVKGDDMAIAVDLLRNTQAGDSVVLVTGDGDFIPLVEEILTRNVQVTLIGALHATNSDWQKLKKQQGFKFISLDSISDEIIKQ